VTEIEMVMLREKIRTVVTLLENEAPKTCEAILNFLPQELDFINGCASGAEALAYLDPPNIVRIEEENLEKHPIPGDVAYWYARGPVNPKGSYAGTSTTDYAELIYFYDRKARSTGVNLFGRMKENLDEFCRASHKIRTEGPIRILIRKLE